MQDLQKSMWNHKILYADRFSEVEQLLIRPLLRESKNTNMVGGRNLKFRFCFMERSHEPLQLNK
jgi:hypothetical protein